ncbi:MAG: thermonuclease family protein [Bacteroidetes bacterium]|nr:thermonuclease family protein [Bacteroidota bacterium]
MKLKYYYILVFFILAGTILDSCSAHREKEKNNEFYRVKRVVDGDTFWLDDGSSKGLKVRLIGIDAPESRKTGHKEIGHYGHEAKEFLNRFLTAEMVRLEFDIEREDKYGRTLAYVYLKDGTFVNTELVKQGYAVALTIPPNVKYANLFVKFQRQARKNELGLWKKR